TVTASEPRSWRPLCEALGLPELVDHELGVEEEATIAALAEAFARRPAAHWLREPGLAGGVGPVSQPRELVEDPQVVHTEGVVPIDDGSGTLVVANPLRFDGVGGADAT